MSDNKLVKIIIDSATQTALVAVIGWTFKKVFKENMTADPSANIMNYVKFTAAMSGGILVKQYLEHQKIIPN